MLHGLIARYRARDARPRRRGRPAAPSPRAEAGSGGGDGGARRAARSRAARRGGRRGAERGARWPLPKADRRALILSYLGYPYFDIATLPLLQGEGLDEFDPIKVDRISPNDAVAIRAGGAAGDAEGAPVQQLRRLLQPRLSRERLSLGPPARRRPADRHRQFRGARGASGSRPDAIAALKRDAFRAILAEEKAAADQHIASLFAAARPRDRLSSVTSSAEPARRRPGLLAARIRWGTGRSGDF